MGEGRYELGWQLVMSEDQRSASCVRDRLARSSLLQTRTGHAASIHPTWIGIRLAALGKH